MMKARLCPVKAVVIAALWAVLPLFCVAPAQNLGQNSGQNPSKWNAEGRLFLRGYKQMTEAKSPETAAKQRALLEENYGLRKFAANGEKSAIDHVSVFLYFEDEEALNRAEEAGFMPQTVVNGLCTGTLPLNRAAEIEAVKGVSRIHLTRKASLLNDVSRKASKVDLIQPEDLVPGAPPVPFYNGEGVIVGIVDIGLDYTHPTFFHNIADRSGYKVKYVWDQMAEGTPPEGADFGAEYAGTDAILAAEHDTRVGEAAHNHGTHVIGTAAGTGAGLPDNRYKGMAPGSDIIMVSTTLQDPDVVDGVAYIMDRAEKEGRPCVVNLSLGSTLGAHDGTAPVDEMLNQLSGPGRLVVAAMGNSGADTIHADGILHKDDETEWRGFYPRDTWSYIQVQSRNKKDVAFTFRLVNKNGEFYKRNGVIEEAVFRTDIPAEEESIIKFDTQPIFSLWAETEESAGATDLYVEVSIIGSTDVIQGYVPCFALSAVDADAVYHLWTYSSSLSCFGVSFLSSGDCEYTLSANIASADSVLAVAAYATRNEWDKADGSHADYSWLHPNVGDICYFSSRGPRTDGVYKPDITAPGAMIVSAGNSFTTELVYSDFYVENTVIDGKDYPWIIMQGTSMASPAATGIVALMLQANPALTPGQLIRIMKETAASNEYVEAEGPTRWGPGIIDAYAAVMKALEESTANEKDMEYAVSGRLKRIYPNPCSDELWLETACGGTLRIIAANGREVRQARFNNEGLQHINVSGLPAGFYLLHFTSPDGKTSFGKLIKS